MLQPQLNDRRVSDERWGREVQESHKNTQIPDAGKRIPRPRVCLVLVKKMNMLCQGGVFVSREIGVFQHRYEDGGDPS